MRNSLILIVSLLAPYALYASGCNQNPQAAFPTTPEMRALARAPETAGRAPFIPAPAIDREILASANDASTKSRVQAVQDKSNVYAMAAPSAGLFVLPAEQTAAGAPMPSAREFWSRPVVAAAQQQRQAQPHYATAPDVYAMAPAGQPFPEAVPVLPALGFEPLPEPITLGPAVPTAGFYSQPQFPQPQSPRQFPPRSVAQPAPALLPAPISPAGPAIPSVPATPYQLRPGEKLLPPETVPGLFLGSDAAGAVSVQKSMAAAGAARSSAEPDSSASPPLLSLAPPGLPPPSSPALASAPQHRASRRLEALLNNTDAAPVLAPLPNVSGKANPAGKTDLPARPAKPIAAAINNISAQAPSPAAPAGLIPPPPAEAKPAAPTVPPADLHDFFRTDFWAAKQSQAPATASPSLRPEPVKEVSKEVVKEAPPAPALPSFPLADAVKPADAKPVEARAPVPTLPLPVAGGLKPPEDFARGWDAALPAVKPEAASTDIEAPARVTLKPIRRKRELQAIDSEVDVAPMNF